jgi:hypothetical protein
MKSEKLTDKLARVAELACSGDALERDLALEILRAVYAEIKFGKDEVQAETPAVAVAEDSVEVVETTDKEFAVPSVEATTDTPPLQEEELSSPPKEEFSIRRRVAPEVIRSLYGGDTPAKKSDDSLDEEYPDYDETPKTDKKEEAPYIPTSGRRDLKHSISVNDKFVMVRDMFDGNSKTFNDTIAYLDTFSDLDEAIIYIHDTYNWSADSDGVKLLVELLENKLG